jgi:very-short-patch-repair endonuclease
MVSGNRSRRSPRDTARARALRRGDNVAEASLWSELKGRQLGGYKFVRQFPVGPFFADFMCREKRLVIEVDGSQHADNQGDRRRDEYMRALGISVIRFWNIDVLTSIDSVCQTILAALEGRYEDDVTAPDLRFVSARTKDATKKGPVKRGGEGVLDSVSAAP